MSDESEPRTNLQAQLDVLNGLHQALCDAVLYAPLELHPGLGVAESIVRDMMRELRLLG